ncbi:DsbA family protein [Marinobacter mangrovi]|uniref:DsbA family protein n=1 Tax=Marinobacter mangrovi TaxID=2803918 RepID=UPI0019335D47|nr:thioredoxin domain-containing protein [Marinobacter mangrovi]
MGEAKRRQATGKRSPVSERKHHRTLLFGAAAAVGVLVLMALLWWVTQPPGAGSDELPVATSNRPFPSTYDAVGVSIGAADAPIVVREFADYQCPACARFAPASEKLRDTYVKEGKVRLVFFDLPLRQHKNAMPAALAARCAADQQAFWPMQDKLYDSQSDWEGLSDPVPAFTRYADELGLDSRRLSRCIETDLHRDVINQSVGVSQKMKVASTPTVYVNNIRLTRPGWAQLDAVIKRELSGQP